MKVIAVETDWRLIYSKEIALHFVNEDGSTGNRIGFAVVYYMWQTGSKEAAEKALSDFLANNTHLELIKPMNIFEVAAAMEKANTPYPRLCCWWQDPEIDKLINQAHKAGWVLRTSATQVEWTQAGVDVWKAKKEEAGDA